MNSKKLHIGCFKLLHKRSESDIKYVRLVAQTIWNQLMIIIVVLNSVASNVLYAIGCSYYAIYKAT